MSHIFNIIILCSALCFTYSFVLGSEINIPKLIAFIIFSASSYFIFRYALYYAAVRREVEDIRREINNEKERTKGSVYRNINLRKSMKDLREED